MYTGIYFNKISDLVAELQQQLRRRVDIVVFNEAPLVLRFHILQDGKLLFCREPLARIRFHEKTVREFLDFPPILKMQAQYLRQRLENGTFGGAQSG
ncbi:nucleotidyltransferase domain-containing protein [Moorellaceae bacterium AZ2]